MTPKKPVFREPGVYLDLPMDDYLNDPALSNSGAALLRQSPLDYWQSTPLNPRYRRVETDARAFGTAMHAALLEPNAFFRRYAVAPDPDAYPDVIDTAEDLRALCAEHGLPRGGTKLEMAERLAAGLAEGATTTLWPLVMRDFMAGVGDRILLSPDVAERVAWVAEIFDRQPGARACVSGGIPEVSVFWTDPDTGVPCRARLDYLTPTHGADLKVFANQMRRPVDEAVGRAWAEYRMHRQGVFHCAAIEAAKDLIRHGRLFADAAPDWMVNDFPGAPPHRFYFVFVGATTPNARVRLLPRKFGKAVTALWSDGENAMRDALNTYARFREAYGTDPWLDPEQANPVSMGDEDVPPWGID